MNTSSECEQIINSINEIVIRVDENLVVQRWNAEAERLLGVQQQNAIGVSFLDLEIQWDDQQKLRGLLQSHRTATKCFKTNVKDAEGVSRVISFSFYPITDQDQFKGYVILWNDLTQHQMLEQQLHQAQKLESVGQLAAGVAHEINTPMQYIGDNISYMQRGFDRLSPFLDDLEQVFQSLEESNPDLLANVYEKHDLKKIAKFQRQIPEALEDAAEGVSNVSRIVRAMKEFSHPGDEDISQVDLNKAIETTLTVARNEYKSVAELTTEFCEDLPMIEGLAGELNQVFLNLLVNASHAIADRFEETGQLGSIHISTERFESGVLVTFQDSGGGIPKEIQDKVFDPFFTTKDVGKGTGQGLFIAHSVIKQKHHGSLEFQVDPGVGTTFRIYLPETQPKSQKPDGEIIPEIPHSVNV